ncbi:hypothetical protein XENOCAPTIV_016422 [Xenoophorus captivus]|uniref:CDP-diacylglycerol--inositol 3-phosphatidyltransferase n=1 Tax=Xenoophorus captivus TaxID=1517983 RepID=A0ABV0RW61_9TELE
MTQENIFLFVPNLIGYARVVLALLSFFLMPCCPWPAVFCYLLSALLDAFDGHAARALNQSTKFGAMMDMLTDRCATMCLLVNLSLLYPSYTFLFQLSMCLDIASHWLHLHSDVGLQEHREYVCPQSVLIGLGTVQTGSHDWRWMLGPGCKEDQSIYRNQFHDWKMLLVKPIRCVVRYVLLLRTERLLGKSFINQTKISNSVFPLFVPTNMKFPE